MDTRLRLVAALFNLVVLSAWTSASRNISLTTDQKTGLQKSNDSSQYGLTAKKRILMKCLINYSVACLKIDMLDFMDNVNSRGSFQIMPGLMLIKRSNSYLSTGLPSDLVSEIDEGKQNSLKELDSVLLQKMEDFIDTYSFRLQPEDQYILKNIKNTGNEIINTLSATNNNRRGRSKKATILWTAGILAAIGFAAMSVVAGKALMASLMALVVAALTALRGVGGAGALSGYRTAHYEIITKPVHYSAPALTGPAHYYDHDHVHHGSNYAPVYDYARTIRADSSIAEERSPTKDKELESSTMMPRSV